MWHKYLPLAPIDFSLSHNMFNSPNLANVIGHSPYELVFNHSPYKLGENQNYYWT